MTTGETIVVIVIAILLLVCIALIVRKVITVIKAIKIAISRLKEQKSLLDGLKNKLTQVEGGVLMAHTSLCEAFLCVRRRCETMVVASKETNDNWRSSAKTSVDLAKIKLRFGHYHSLKVPYAIPKIPINKSTTCYVYPSFLLVDYSGHLTAYENSDVDFKFSNYRLIVDASDLTRDSVVVDYTYRYVNYDGTPDGRFANNDKRPIVLYGSVEILPLGEEIIVSKKDAAKDLCDSFLNLKKAIQRAETERSKAFSFDLNYPPIITPE